MTPVGPVGDWRPAGAAALPAGNSALADFDPFFRLSAGSGPAVVTGLNLKLYGVREDRATGRGSAIIALPDGTQSSFAVGDEIMPGVRLVAVGFDNVTIDRNGSAEQIFLDQSEPAPPAAGAPPDAAAPHSGAVAAPATSRLPRRRRARLPRLPRPPPMRPRPCAPSACGKATSSSRSTASRSARRRRPWPCFAAPADRST